MLDMCVVLWNTVGFCNGPHTHNSFVHSITPQNSFNLWSLVSLLLFFLPHVQTSLSASVHFLNRMWVYCLFSLCCRSASSFTLPPLESSITVCSSDLSCYWDPRQDEVLQSGSFSWNLRTSQFRAKVTLQNVLREVHSSNFMRVIFFPVWEFVWNSSVPLS